VNDSLVSAWEARLDVPDKQRGRGLLPGLSSMSP
jgi:hypothetical protein